MSVYYIVALIVSIVILGLYLYAKRLKNLTVKIIILIPALVFGFFMYLVGYIPELLTAPVAVGHGKFFVGIVKTLVSTAAMLAGRADYASIKDGNSYFLTAAFTLPFYLAHFLAFAVTIMAAVSLFGRRTMPLLKRLRWPGSDTYVIFGVNPKSLCLGESILEKDAPKSNARNSKGFPAAAADAHRLFEAKNRRFVIFIDETAGTAAIGRIAKMGAALLREPVFYGGQLHPDALRKAGFRKGRRREIFAFAFTESDMTNCCIADGLWDAARRKGISAETLRGIYVYTGSKTVVEALEAKRLRLEQSYREALEALAEKSDGDALKSPAYTQETQESAKIRFLEQLADQRPELRSRTETLRRELNYRYNISCFSEAALAARLLFTKYPPYKRLTFDTQTGLATSPPGKPLPAITVFILGFGATGRQVFEQALMNSQFENCAFRAVIVDKCLGDIEGRILQDYPALFDKNCVNDIVIDFCPEDIGHTSLYEKLKKLIRRQDGACDADYIVATLGDADKNVEALTNIRNFLIRNHVSPNKLPVLAAHIGDSPTPFSSGERENRIGNVTVFGGCNEVFTRDIVINETLDSMARAIHAFCDASGVTPWELLPLDLKNSNRAAASYIGAYLHMMKLRLLCEGDLEPPVPAGMTEADFQSAVERQPRLENLARTEHLRWNAFHFAAGWTRKPLEEVTGWESREDALTKRQVCLVGWDALTDLGWIGDFKESDRAAIRNIAKVIASYNSTAPQGKKLILIPYPPSRQSRDIAVTART